MTVPDGEADGPRRRTRRRATGGTPSGTGSPPPSGSPTSTEPPTGRDRDRPRVTGSRTDVPLLPGRSTDDTDAGWGERPEGGDDERLLREVPPHW